MATWRIDPTLHVTYHGHGGVQDCGRPTNSAVKLADTEAWCISNATTWDVVESPRGRFVRQSEKAVRG